MTHDMKQFQPYAVVECDRTDRADRDRVAMHDARGGMSWTLGVVARVRRIALATDMNAPAIKADECETVAMPDSAATTASTTHRKANRSAVSVSPSTDARRARIVRADTRSARRASEGDRV